MSCSLNYIAKFGIFDLNNQSGPLQNPSPLNNDGIANKPHIGNSLISLSPFGDIAVVASKTSAVVLTAKWNYSNDVQDKETYKVTSDIDIKNYDIRGSVTAVLCLPLGICGQDGKSRQSQQNCTLDWTCIAVAFNSGYIHFYNEAGNLLYSKQLYSEPILSLKCQSFQPANHEKLQDEFSEEIYVQYKSVLICIPGSIIFPILRKRRIIAAKGAWTSSDASDSSDATPLSYKIWKFSKQECIADCEVVGPSSSSLFDHLRSASFLGGFHETYQAAPPKTTQLVACGSNDFVGFHYYFESVSGPSDWKRVITTTLTKTVVGLFSSRKNSSKPEEDIVTSDELVNRFSITDPVRKGRSIIRSPNREYLAVTDNLGRVCLIDSVRGTVVRKFKGYREAECGWLTVEDESLSRGSDRTVYLLVIYSSRTGRIEIWPVPFGTVVAVLDGGKGGRLLYSSHRLVGLKNQTVNWRAHQWRSCTFLNSEGKLFEINVPFYCILSDGEDKAYAHDSCLLKRLMSFLRETNGTDEEVAQEVGLTAAALKSTPGMLECLKLLSASRNTNPEAVEAAVAVFIDKVSVNREKQSTLLAAERSLRTKSIRLRHLVSLFKYARKQQDSPPDYFSVVGSGSASKEAYDLSSQLFASRQDIRNLRMRLTMKLKRSTDVVKRVPVVTFKEKLVKSTFRRFLSCFDIERDEDAEDRGFLSLNLASCQPPNEKTQFLSDFLFRDVVFSSSDLSKFREEFASGISPIHLTLLALHFWLNTELSDAPEKDMIRFAQIIGIICQMEPESNVASDYNEISPWWNKVRDVLMDSTCPLNALTAALACRSVAIRIECQIDAQYIKSVKLAWSDSDDSDDSSGSEDQKKKREKGSGGEWEAMSTDRARWNLLIALLEDVTILDCILRRNPRSETKNMIGKPLPMLGYTKPVISLSKILRNGTGSISKMVAQWLASSGIVAASVVDSTDVEWQSLRERSERNQKRKCDMPAPFFGELKAADVILEGREAFASQCLRFLKWHFPFSLTGSVLLMELSFLYFQQWSSSVLTNPNESRDFFDGAMSCLACLPSPHIKKGLCISVWNMFIWKAMQECQCFTSAYVRQVGFDSRPEYSVWRNVSSQCLAFIRLFFEANEQCDLREDIEGHSAFYQHDHLWNSNIAENILYSPSTLSRVLSMRNWKNLPLSLALQMASVMQMVIELNIQLKNYMKILFGENQFCKVVNTFTENANPALFKIHHGDVLTRRRYDFLVSVVTAAHESLSALPLENDKSETSRSSMESAVRWMGRCEELVLLWDLDYDELRRCQVCLLYCAGFDSRAEEILPAVKEREKLARSLLNIAECRYKLFLEQSPHIAENISSMGPNVFSPSLMHGTESQVVRQVELGKTLHLLRYIHGILPNENVMNFLEAVEAIVYSRTFNKTQVDV